MLVLTLKVDDIFPNIDLLAAKISAAKGLTLCSVFLGFCSVITTNNGLFMLSVLLDKI